MGQTRAARTMSFAAAVSSIDSVRMMVDADYVVPIFLYFFLNFVGFIAVFIGFGHPVYFSQPTILLGGLQDQFAGDPYTIYQTDTFTVVAMAFFGAYVYALGRLLDRINNHDLYPISLYYYTVRFVIACASAAVLRHSISIIDGTYDNTFKIDVTAVKLPTLILLGSIIGFAPDLFIIAFSRKAFQTLKIWGSRADPVGDDKPTSLPLLMIDDITREKIDRLDELGIDSAQVLARQNPFMLLPRLPYELGLLMDWIAQSQLYVLVKDATFQRLRTACIRDILDLHIRLSTEGSRAATCQLLGRPEGDAIALIRQLESDTCFLRLKELVMALNQSAVDALAPAVSPAAPPLAAPAAAVASPAPSVTIAVAGAPSVAPVPAAPAS